MRELRAAQAALGGAVLCVGTSAILTRLTAGSPLAVAAWRLGIAAVLLGTWPGAWFGLRHASGGDILRSALAAVFLAVHFGAWIASLRMLPVAVSVLVVSTHPILILSWRMATGEWPALREAVGALLAFVGVAAIYGAADGHSMTPGAGSAQTGFALALTGAFALAGYLLVSAEVRRRVQTSTYLLMVNGLAAIALFAFLAGAGGRTMQANFREIAVYFALAVVPTLGGHGLFAYAVGKLNAIVVSVAFLMEPIIATLLAIPIFHEVPGSVTVAGGAATLAGLLLVVAQSTSLSCEAGLATRNK